MTLAASPIDWDRAERVAINVSRRRSPAPGPAGGGTVDLPTGLLEAQIESVTGLRAPSPATRVEHIDRTDWIRANIASFRQLLAPLLDRWPDAPQRLSGVSRTIGGAELGMLLGWMSTRVLGQYDLLLSDDPSADGPSDGAVYLVAPNLDAVEQRFGFDPQQFRTWVLLHELTHRAQFTGVPWMRGHFRGLVDEGLGAIDPSPQAFFGALKDAISDRSEARRRVHDNGIVGLVATPEQRAVFARVSGLMSLLEGHGDVTMTRAAGDLVPDAERFGRVLAERRKQAKPLARVVQRLLGLEAKLDQYAAGERFIEAIEASAGPHAVDRCWVSPVNLPTLEEIRTPRLWLDRLDVVAA